MKLQAELHGSFFSCSNDFQFVSDLKSNVTQYGMLQLFLFIRYLTNLVY